MASDASNDGSVSNLLVVPVVEALVSLGADIDAIMASATLEVGFFDDAQQRIDGADAYRFWQAAVDITGDPELGLTVARRLKPGAAGAFEYLLRHSQTLGESLSRADRFLQVLDDRSEVALEIGAELATFRIWRSGSCSFHPADLERFFALCSTVMEGEFPGYPLAEVRFAHSLCKGARMVSYRRHFGCPVSFDGLHNELCFPAVALQHKPRSADPALGLVLEAHVEKLLAELPSEPPFLKQARRMLAVQLRTGNAGLDKLASALHLGSRTLRRRLAEHGHTYTSLCDDLRESLAKHYLRSSDMGVDQVAHALGFADPSTFNRSFKRWTGETPSQYRKRPASHSPT